MFICVKGGHIVDPVSDFEGDGNVWIKDGMIKCIETGDLDSEELPVFVEDEDVKFIDAKGKWVVPGFVDLHVHFREPGHEYKEDIMSGSNAAKKGGFTKVCCMPNTRPVIDCGEVVDYINDKSKDIPGIKVYVIGAVTKGQDGKELSDFDGMAAAGIRAVSEDGKSVMNAWLMREAMKKAKSLELPIFSHAEDTTLAGLPIGEEVIVSRDILLAKDTGCRLHFCHISTEWSVELIRKAKADGLDVTAETAPHYFTLDKGSVNRDGNKKMNPPLRALKDIKAIRDALADGTLDAIATDHAPHSKAEKESEFEEAPSGVIGLETSFAVSYSMLVKTGLLTPLKLISLMSSKPAEILGIKPSSIAAGEPADIVMLDVDEEYTIDGGDFASKGANSPFIGMTVSGRPIFLHEIWE